MDKGFFLFVELPVLACFLVVSTILAAIGAAPWTTPLLAFVCLLISPLQWLDIRRRERIRAEHAAARRS